MLSKQLCNVQRHNLCYLVAYICYCDERLKLAGIFAPLGRYAIHAAVLIVKPRRMNNLGDLILCVLQYQ